MSRYIDANKLQEENGKAEFYAYVPEICEAVDAMIKNQPTADVQKVRHGKWTKIERENVWGNMVEVFQCSACGKWKIRSEGIMKPSRYCPNCGAKMEE